jgi:cobalt-zinc-cadmium resistance protein CzcA
VNNIIAFSINNKLLIGIFILLWIIWGIFSLYELPIDAVPDITNNQVQVITHTGPLATQEVERLVTFPIEQHLVTVPGIEEFRSFSRSGLSLITIVFNDAIDIYWARQQISERLQIAKNQISPLSDSPELAPVTTGLGEIYQYIVYPKKGYENRYSITELRTIQDWIIRRQLLGIRGVAEVSSLGGFVKQYEVAINPERLKNYQISLAEIITALEKNNQNTGGTYIERKANTYFIRSEGVVESPEDIEKIVVKYTKNDFAITIGKIATVQYGHSSRWGAITYNNQGEAVGGIIMMLKGENSNAVVSRVRERVAQIQKTLPEGLEISAFLDRSELVNRAIGTIQTNLIEGALIVIGVLILFLGNLKAGLIVASVIPLSMLFALAMMRLFGVSGNLMSLGAIDFGLVVDGAIIVVEGVLHHLASFSNQNRFSSQRIDAEVYQAATKIRNAAVFGEIIILIVYIPILLLVGIEGKMFRPMAQTVSFTILGAFILSLTYVPMMSALLLSNKKQVAILQDKLMNKLINFYTTILRKVLKYKWITISVAVFIFCISLIIFLNLGGEFLPTLEEGDFAVEVRLLPGSSISQTVDVSLKASTVLLERFPDEVKKVVSKIGSGEVPTDPMPMEAGDLMVILKDKKDWKKAAGREELAEKMQAELQDIPGVDFGFQQPIQMRFNELMTGIKQDVAIKIFGEDLEKLTYLSEEVAKVIGKIPGVKDLYVEQMGGRPEIYIRINRDQLLKHKVSVEAVNQAIRTAFAGTVTGYVYENERKYELVVRFDKDFRNEVEDVANLYVTNIENKDIPLAQLATIKKQLGPNQIQREDAKRRVVIGFNTRGRDVKTIIEDIKKKIDKEIKFPSGYYVVFGGQFENLEQAQARLAVAIPLTLLLILLLLYFSFNSIIYALLIFSSIPMAVIGGIFMLLIRGMVFSISAGMGFIALFGVAVLNGIVLISEFNRLRKSDINNIMSLEEVVIKGGIIRLRPVLMTAAVASLGFFPMALATSAGAEVQKPLATVVIGGLISSTFLTLIVLPCTYILVEKIKMRIKNEKNS